MRYAAEAGAPLRGGIGAAVVGRHDLDVLDLPLAVRSLVFDANVGKMDVAVDHRKITAGRPLRHVGGVAVGVLFLPAALAFQIVEEPLVVPLQLVVEDDACDNRALLLEALGRSFVRAVELGVVRQFARLHEAGVERLRSAVAVGRPMSLQQFATAIRQRHEGRPVATDDVGARLHKACLPKGSQLAVAGACGASAVVPKIGGHDDPEGAGRRQHPDLGLAQIDRAISVPDRPARRAAWQIQIARQRVAQTRRVSTRRRRIAAALARLRSGRSRSS